MRRGGVLLVAFLLAGLAGCAGGPSNEEAGFDRAAAERAARAIGDRLAAYTATGWPAGVRTEGPLPVIRRGVLEDRAHALPDRAAFMALLGEALEDAEYAVVVDPDDPADLHLRGTVDVAPQGDPARWRVSLWVTEHARPGGLTLAAAAGVGAR